MKQLELKHETAQVPATDHAKAPKLLSFVDGKDDLDAYLQHFERFATTAKWEKIEWASNLNALLSGRTLDVYSSLSEESASDYDLMKFMLMKRYNLIKDGYRRKFRNSKPETDMMLKQFINSCPKEIAVHSRERAPETLREIAKIAGQNLLANGRHLFSLGRKTPTTEKTDESKKPLREGGTPLQCFRCNSREHKL